MPIEVKPASVEEVAWVREQIMRFHIKTHPSLLGRGMRRLFGMLTGARR